MVLKVKRLPQGRNLSPRARSRLLRHARLRKKIRGTAERPRLCVFRSNRHIFAQIIDDTKGHTYLSASTMEKDVSNQGTKTDQARQVGAILALRAKSKGIESVVFDTGGNKYFGRVRAVADGAREGGLKF